MRRKEINATIRKGGDASCIGNNRGMAKRAKRHGAKTLRQKLKKRLSDN